MWARCRPGWGHAGVAHFRVARCTASATGQAHQPPWPTGLGWNSALIATQNSSTGVYASTGKLTWRQASRALKAVYSSATPLAQASSAESRCSGTTSASMWVAAVMTSHRVAQPISSGSATRSPTWPSCAAGRAWRCTKYAAASAPAASIRPLKSNALNTVAGAPKRSLA